jgi:hypothetical protein
VAADRLTTWSEREEGSGQKDQLAVRTSEL